MRDETVFCAGSEADVVFASLPDGVMLCRREGEIVRVNEAVVRMLGLGSGDEWVGRRYQEVLRPYVCGEGRRMSEMGEGMRREGERVREHAEGDIMELRVPSGRRVYVEVRCVDVGGNSVDGEKNGRVKGEGGMMLLVVHEMGAHYLQMVHLKRVHEAVTRFTEAIAKLPDGMPRYITDVLSGSCLLLSPPVVYVAQQLVDVIRRVIDCQRTIMKALDEETGRLYYMVGSGLVWEHEALERRTSGLFTMKDTMARGVVERLQEGKVVIARGSEVDLPKNFEVFAGDHLLFVPLLLHDEMVGFLCTYKDEGEGGYTEDVVELVKAVATQAGLVIDFLSHLRDHMEGDTREYILQEVRRMSGDFLMLASHELRTPLTGVMGNIQLAQRYLVNVRGQVNSETGERIGQVEQSLVRANRSADVQKRMINDIVDDARIQAHVLELHCEKCNLRVLLEEVIQRLVQYEQRGQSGNHEITLEVDRGMKDVMADVDVERIRQVCETYIANALIYSTAGEPVEVRMSGNKDEVKVEVHNEGVWIDESEQKRVWERFYRAKGYTFQNELDLSLGLGLYLCRSFVELHHGQVGVESAPKQGATFWFTVPRVPGSIHASHTE